ncbi:MAG: AGE family epimerase/isomerase [Bacteroidales bacterium]
MNYIIQKLKDELHQELTGNILPFWLHHTPDREHGGFIGHIDFEGAPSPRANKGSVLNARILWTFSSSFRILKQPEYLASADRAYDYIKNNFLDREWGGVFWKLDYQGNPLDPKKQIYAQAFTIYGMTEYYRATGNQEALDIAVGLYLDIEKHSFDPVKNGYFEAFTRNWELEGDLRLSEKDLNESKTMNTHLHILEAYTNLYRVWENSELKVQLRNLVYLFTNYFLNESGHLNLFFDEDWNLKSDLVSFGHDIECSWLLHEAADVLDDEDLKEQCGTLAVKIARQNMKGLDNDGGLFYEYFPTDERWDTDKHWWPQAEAIVGYYHAHRISGLPEFLDAAMQSWRFIQNYMIDKENGEWHWRVDKQGRPYFIEEKAGFWKCPYHNSRACLEVISSPFNYSLP